MTMRRTVPLTLALAATLAGCSNVDIDWDGITFKEPPPPPKTEERCDFAENRPTTATVKSDWLFSAGTRFDREGVELAGVYAFDGRRTEKDSGNWAWHEVEGAGSLRRRVSLVIAFRPEDFGPGHRHLITLGPAARMISLGFTPEGVAKIGLNNHERTHTLATGPIPTGRHTVIALSYDESNHLILVAMNGRVTDRIRLPDTFSLSCASDPYCYQNPGNDDRRLTFHDFSTGETFRGRVKSVDVYFGALSETECAEKSR